MRRVYTGRAQTSQSHRRNFDDELEIAAEDKMRQSWITAGMIAYAIAGAALGSDRPLVTRWEFGTEEITPLRSHGGVHRDVPGPRPPDYPDFEPGNTAIKLDGKGAYLSFDDAGAGSPFDFTNGDEITLEAWVQVDELRGGENVYVIGKGRTGAAGFAADNQNWALRVRETQGQAGISFLFATIPDVDSAKNDEHWHRWTTKSGFAPGKGWHHIAVAYRFGDSKSIRGWIDGQARPGAWDMGGATNVAPVVDDDAIWIGSSRGGAVANSFRGSLDSIAVHRQVLDDAVMKIRFRFTGSSVASTPVPEPAPEVMPQPESFPKGKVLLSLFEGLTAHDRWLNNGEKPPQQITQVALDGFLLERLPQRFDAWGIRESWKAPVLVQLAADLSLKPGKHRFLMRVRGLSRLWVNGEVIARSKPHPPSPSGEEPITPVAEPPAPGARIAEHRQQEIFGEVTIGQDEKCRVVLETLVGGKAFRADPGETCVAVQSEEGGPFLILPPPESASTGMKVLLTDADVIPALAMLEKSLRDFDDQTRRAAASGQDAYWNKRHDMAREWSRQHPAPSPPQSTIHPVDAFLEAKIKQVVQEAEPPLTIAAVESTLILNDAQFLRRVFLDTVGVPPSEQDVRSFLNDEATDKRRSMVERLLADPRWADHWMSYWQDVLAENPTLLNSSLNTTGPFRWFLYDALRDGKGLDRLMTELILLRGSPHEGGSAGFGIAADNDAPFAAKGQILGTAFLGIELQCARCHDSPFHSTSQQDLYALAAMLEKKPVAVPKTGRVPAAFFTKQARESLIKVTLKPDQQIAPIWPFAATTGIADDADLDALLQNPDDARERLAVLITAPRNSRFAQVVVNRIWRRFIGAGIVEPVHDWEGRAPSHPELLAWLAQEFVTRDYDVKHIARLILTSRLYQLPATGRNLDSSPERRLFLTPERRRLSAEQIVDSLHAAAGLPMDVEELTFDPDGRRASSNRLTLGIPTRAWMFASLANERDRPALSLPRARAIADIMEAFGWSGSRQSPRTDRESSPNALQPGILANGTAATLLTRVTPGSGLAEIAIEASSPEQIVDRVFLRYLGRMPTEAERALLAAALAEGFQERLLPATDVRLASRPEPLPRVTWSNHLQAAASTISLELERRARTGPAPDPRLRPEWREVFEDVVWSVVNIREFVWMP